MQRNQGFHKDLRLAKRIWGSLKKPLMDSLLGLLKRYRLSVTAGDLLLIDKASIPRLGRLIAALLGRNAFGFAVAGIVDDEDRDAELFAQLEDRPAAMAQVARVAVTIEKGATAWLRAFRRTPPGVNRHAVFEDELDVLCVNL